VVPQDPDGLRCALGEAHRRYTREINFRNGWRGHLWQERFHSFLLDQPYLLAAARYIENNPVRAGLCAKPDDWPWSSARAHLVGQDDALVKVGPLLELIRDWRDYLRQPNTPSLADEIHAHTQTGRPLGGEAFVKELEGRLKRALRPQKRGPKPRQAPGENLDLISDQDILRN
jgi:putative transposase